ncbi:hypothetical protein HDU99_007820, partial [Rhizoclosmatium hyalinum]
MPPPPTRPRKDSVAPLPPPSAADVFLSSLNLPVASAEPSTVAAKPEQEQDSTTNNDAEPLFQLDRRGDKAPESVDTTQQQPPAEEQRRETVEPPKRRRRERTTSPCIEETERQCTPPQAKRERTTSPAPATTHTFQAQSNSHPSSQNASPASQMSSLVHRLRQSTNAHNNQNHHGTSPASHSPSSLSTPTQLSIYTTKLPA